jgi:NAD(P)-dependent dehydrogenase (short-subunit alcohol dehydrogenase family)
VRTDVTDLDSVNALADRAHAAFGAVHVLCNNAGVAAWGGLESATHRDWQWVLGVNLWGVIHGIEAFVPRMIAGQQGGHIVNTASMAGLIASQGLGVYNTSKPRTRRRRRSARVVPMRSPCAPTSPTSIP